MEKTVGTELEKKSENNVKNLLETKNKRETKGQTKEDMESTKGAVDAGSNSTEASGFSSQENKEKAEYEDSGSGKVEIPAKHNARDESLSICDEIEPLLPIIIEDEDLFVEHLCNEMFACLMNTIQNNPAELFEHDI